MSSVYSACFSFSSPNSSLSQDFREADDGVERRAQLMRHVGEKFRFVPVSRFDLTALVLDLTKQPRVLDCQGGLRGEGLQQINDFGFKFTGLPSPDGQASHDPLFAEKWDRKKRTITEPRQRGPHPRASVFSLIGDVGNLNGRPSRSCPSGGALTQTYRCRPQRLNHLFFHTVAGPQMKLLFGLIVLVDDAAIGSRKLDGVRNNRGENRFKV